MKTLLVLATLLTSFSSFAYMCRVDLVDTRGYVIQSFSAQRDLNGTCRDGLRLCKQEQRYRNVYGSKCETRQGSHHPGPGYGNGGYNPGPGYGNGGYNPGPGYGNGYGQNRFQHLLRLSDFELVQEAAFGIGMCSVTRGSWGSSCEFYVKRNGFGYPQGTGCAKSQYTSMYGCNSWSEEQNAGCMIRKAIMRGDC